MSPLDLHTIECVDRMYPGGVWDVLRGCDAPEDMPVCQSYPCASVAGVVLDAAGFRCAAQFVRAPELDGRLYDVTTQMRFTAGNGQDVVLVRRR